MCIERQFKGNVCFSWLYYCEVSFADTDGVLLQVGKTVTLQLKYVSFQKAFCGFNLSNVSAILIGESTIAAS